MPSTGRTGNKPPTVEQLRRWAIGDTEEISRLLAQASTVAARRRHRWHELNSDHAVKYAELAADSGVAEATVNKEIRKAKAETNGAET